MTNIEEQTTRLLFTLADDVPTADFEDFERRLGIAASKDPTIEGDAEVMLLNSAERLVSKEQRVMPAIVAAAVLFFLGLGFVSVVGLAEPTGSSSASGGPLDLETGIWTQRESGPIVVDLGSLVDDSLTWPPDLDITYTLIDTASLPGQFEIGYEDGYVLPWSVSESMVTYSQEITAESVDGVDLHVTLRGSTSLSDSGNGLGAESLPSGWRPQPIRGTDGRTNGKAIAWIEPNVGLVTIRSTSGNQAELLDLVEELEFTTTTEVDQYLLDERAPTWESTATPVFTGPDVEGRSAWTFDTSEVLVVNGLPGSTGRIPKTSVVEPTVIAVVNTASAAVAGVAPTQVTSIRVVTSRGITTELPTAMSPMNQDNNLFAFGLPAGLDAIRLELLDANGDPIFSYEIPFITFPAGHANLILEPSS